MRSPEPAVSPTMLDDLSDADVVRLYAYPDGLPPGRPWIRANMVTTLDGAVAGADGLSGSIAPAGDRRLFSLLRGMCDVILVGARTVRGEHYGPARVRPAAAEPYAAGRRPRPTVAVLSRSMDFDFSTPLFTQAAEPTLLLTVSASDPARRRAAGRVAEVVVAGDTDVDVGLAMTALVERGLVRVLAEGGPRVLGQVAAAGLLDELCLTISPLMIGGAAGRILAGDALQPPVPLEVGHVLSSHAGALFTRWVRA